METNLPQQPVASPQVDFIVDEAYLQELVSAGFAGDADALVSTVIQLHYEDTI